MGYSFQYPPIERSENVKFTLGTTNGSDKPIPSNAKVERTSLVWNKNYTAKEARPTLWSIEFNSLEELAEFSNVVQDGIIISSNEGMNVEDIAQYHIEIYNDWRE